MSEKKRNKISKKVKSEIDLDNGNYSKAKPIKEVRKITAKFKEALSEKALRLRHGSNK